MATDTAQQHPLTWALSRWILWVLLAAHLWILVTGRDAVLLEYPRGPAALMIVGIGGIAFNSWRRDLLRKKPSVAVSVMSALAFIAAIVVGVAVA